MMKKISCIAIDDEPIALLIISQFWTARDWPVQTGSGFSGY